jgi:pimeloyl-ACP methyl ester carboxylesterase
MTDIQRFKHTLLMLHGITATKQSLGGSAEVFAQALGADRLVVPDMPFHGQGEKLATHDVPEMLEWFDAQVRRLLQDTDRLTVVAHSYASVIMLYWAERHAETMPQVRLAAVAPPLRITRTARHFDRVVRILPKRMSWHAFAGPRVKPLIQAYISTYPRREPDRSRIYRSTKHDDNDYGRYLMHLKMNELLYNYMSEHPISDVHQHTLLLLFGKDLVVDSARLADELNEQKHELVQVRYVPDAGHLLISQDPDRLAGLIAGWERA